MLDVFGQFQSVVFWGLVLVSLGLKGYALVDALRQPTAAFPVAGKLTKPIWLAIVGVSAAAQVVLLNPLNMVNLLGAVAAIVYLVDVRPAVQQVRGGGTGRMGPYGPW